MLEFIDDGQRMRVCSQNVYTGEVNRWTDFDGKTIWLFDGSFGALNAQELKQIAEHMMKLNESEAA